MLLGETKFREENKCVVGERALNKISPENHIDNETAYISS
jgi:hypothetical protein